MAEIVSKNPVNDPTPKSVDTRSTFDLGQGLAQTHRFGEITPILALETVAGDKLPYRLKHDLRSYTLKAPLMQNINLNKDAFFVPAECILPMNWDKIFTNPLLGQDVNPLTVGCTVGSFTSVMANFFSSFSQEVKIAVSTGTEYTDSMILETYLKWLIGIEMIYSNGSLLSVMGAHLSPLCSTGLSSFDRFFDNAILSLRTYVSYFVVYDFFGNGNDGIVVLDPDFDRSNLPSGKEITIHQFLESARDGFSWSIDSVSLVDDSEDASLIDVFNVDDVSFSSVEFNLNLARFFAYQIVCAHYYTNDKIDYIYDANLYRQNIYDAIINVTDSVGDSGLSHSFSLNGSQIPYDYCSAYYFNWVVGYSYGLAGEASEYFPILDYLRLIFGFNRSLRYVDYFTGSKSRPLAVGDVNVSVNASKVNAVDITRKIQVQRFLNAVNRTGRRISEYVKGIFGVSQAPDYHNPFFLSHTRDFVGNQEIENTGNYQFDTDYPNSSTTVLRSNSERYEFDFEADRVGILIAVQYYDIPRFYYRGVERLMTHADRYEMFNPMMQFIGDQEVSNFERDITDSGTFGYTMRHMEYKQRYNSASGGFIEFLPGYLFLADEGASGVDLAISPSFIRSRPSELDKFYLSLTGYSLASYFHFIVITNNMCDGSRPMAYAPTIL